jgi:hypothetical protein
MDYKIPALLLLGVVLVSGCTEQQEPPPTRTQINEATLACVSLCQQKLNEGRDLSQGPCLSGEIIDNWVCDVAHAPRTQVDNDPINQCPAYGDTASHFVEVDPECNFIRAV